MSRLRTWLDELAVRQVRIDPESWHYRLYRYWVEVTGGNPPGYQENLCHYVRVLLIWAPWNWFKFHTVVGFVRPWTIAYSGFLTALLYVYLTGQEEIGVWAAIWVVLYMVGVAGILLVSWGLKAEENDQEQEKHDPKERGDNAIGRLIAPAILVFAVCFIVIPKFVELTWKRLFGPWLPGIVRWFFTARLGYPWITPFSLTLVSSFFVALIFFTRYVVVTILFLIIIGLIIVMIFWGLLSLDKAIADHRRRAYRGKFGSGFVRGVGGTISLALRYLVAVKKGICPFITLPKE